MKKLLLFFALFTIHYSLFTASGLAEDHTFPTPIGYVNDFANVISPDYEQKIANVIAEVKEKTGAEIAVVSVPTVRPSEINLYANELFKKWGIGQKGKDNGILIIAAINDRKARIEVGYGLEGILPDGKCGRIMDEYLIPNFKAGAHAKGFYETTLVIAGIIAKDKGVALTFDKDIPSSSMGKDDLNTLALIIIVLILVVIIGISARRSRYYGGPGPGGYWGGSGGSSGGGGFGGFGGGSSGGGGSSRGW